MANFTKIQLKPSMYVQPPLEGTVSVLFDPGVDMFTQGQTVHIPDAGIYDIVSIAGLAYVLKLKTAIAAPGSKVTATVMYPIGNNGTQTLWGGPNGKEW